MPSSPRMLKGGEQPTWDDTATEVVAATSPRSVVRGRLFQKYILLFLGLVSVTLLLNVAIDLWFAYREDEARLAQVQLEKADAAAERIEQFFAEIESQIGWTTYVQWAAETLEQRRFDYFRLLRQVPAIMELSELDSQGKEQLKVSRLAMDVVRSEVDFSQDPRFTEAVAHKLWFSAVSFRDASEPYITLAIARAGRDAGVTVADVNLKLIWGVISAIKVGDSGYAFVVDRAGRLVAHPNIGLVLHNMNFNRLPYVAASLRNLSDRNSGPALATVQTNFNGERVLTAHAVLPALGWLVFVELPDDRGARANLLIRPSKLPRAAGRTASRHACRDIHGPSPGRSHSDAAGWCGSDWGRKSEQSDNRKDRRRTRGSGGPVQHDGGSVAGVQCRTGADRRRTHSGSRALRRRADRRT